MCKIVFIGTVEELKDTYFKSTLYIETVDNELLTIVDKFENPHVYFVGTSEECSCGFGIQKDYNPYQKSDEDNESLQEDKDFYEQTLKLIEIIEENTTSQNPTEFYCCWVGDYSLPAEKIQIVNLAEVSLIENFEINERVKTKFIRI